MSGTFFISQHLDNDINIRYNIYINVSEGDDYMENEVKLKMISDNKLRDHYSKQASIRGKHYNASVLTKTIEDFLYQQWDEIKWISKEQ